MRAREQQSQCHLGLVSGRMIMPLAECPNMHTVRVQMTSHQSVLVLSASTKSSPCQNRRGAAWIRFTCRGKCTCQMKRHHFPSTPKHLNIKDAPTMMSNTSKALNICSVGQIRLLWRRPVEPSCKTECPTVHRVCEIPHLSRGRPALRECHCVLLPSTV